MQQGQEEGEGGESVCEADCGVEEKGLEKRREFRQQAE
jgi:hypothetical protein